MVELCKCTYTQIMKIFKRYIERPIKLNVLEQISEYKFTPADTIAELKNFLKIKHLDDGVLMKRFMI